jgi:hypothetical protein
MTSLCKMQDSQCVPKFDVAVVFVLCGGIGAGEVWPGAGYETTHLILAHNASPAARHVQAYVGIRGSVHTSHGF